MREIRHRRLLPRLSGVLLRCIAKSTLQAGSELRCLQQILPSALHKELPLATTTGLPSIPRCISVSLCVPCGKDPAVSSITVQRALKLSSRLDASADKPASTAADRHPAHDPRRRSPVSSGDP